MFSYYRKLNIILGWLIFAVGAFVYISTAEPTASFWDCGEYIATSYKLQVGHPPGAPTFQLLARIFTLFASSPENVAFMVNLMSALVSAFTVMFLFWIITYYARRLFVKEELSDIEVLTVLGAGLIGSLAYMFSDSFWFNAVEGEVYATSSFFTALVFWAMIKWDEEADQPSSYRWLIFIAFMVGLSIGVHLLNLLTLPALVMIYYYRKFKVNLKGVVVALILSVILLGFMFYLLIPGLINWAGKIEIFFVNQLGLPFNSGTIFYFLFWAGLLTWAIIYTHRKGKIVWNTIALAFTFILIGYSTFLTLVIRSNAGTPINENAPKDAPALLSYLNREQYGTVPLFYGQYFNAPFEDGSKWKDGTPKYERDDKLGKYVIIDERKKAIPRYQRKFCTIFPRMWSNQEDSHIDAYISWTGMKESDLYYPAVDQQGNPVIGRDGKVVYDRNRPKNPPSFIKNLLFFFKYQLGHMYFRYFLWNFSGRQNDIQGHGAPHEGNWITGISFIDQALYGDQDKLPSDLKNNKGNNKYYLLPLILGLIGLFYHLNKHPKDFFIVFLFFIMTGIAIVVYLNQYPYQPRERDYAYVGSFYAFAVWIGLGIVALTNWLRKIKLLNNSVTPIGVTLMTFFAVPYIMAHENWDDHDRSNRYTARDFAKNYLASCPPNAILFTNGDNDTFPLWYVQEVEGFRTDVRVVNMSLFNTDWYADQVKKKAYDSDPVPMSMSHEQYRQGTRDIVYLFDGKELGLNVKGYVNLKELFNILHKSPEKLKMHFQGMTLDYFPTRKFYIPVDKKTVLENGVVPPHMADKIVDSVKFEINRRALQKNALFLLDILAHFDWKRPICFAVTTGSDVYYGLQNYFALEGMVYRLVPIYTPELSEDGSYGWVNTQAMYDNMMNKFVWGNVNGDDVYLDENNLRFVMNFRQNFARLAKALIRENKIDSALKVLDKACELFPKDKAYYNFFVLPIAEAYLEAKAYDKGLQVLEDLMKLTVEKLDYLFTLRNDLQAYVSIDKQQNLFVMQQIINNLEKINNTENIDSTVKDRVKNMLSGNKEKFDSYLQMFMSSF
ncbi:MAG: DUF2723 domain-containing protein [Bacteroidales bacterium]|nr:DUF2723 domain-containing protein [Bacteroidales bacterium]